GGGAARTRRGSSGARGLEVQRPALLKEADRQGQHATGGVEPHLDVELVVGALVDAPYPPCLEPAPADLQRRPRIDAQAHGPHLARARQREIDASPLLERAARQPGQPPQLADQADAVLRAGRHREHALADRTRLAIRLEGNVARLPPTITPEGKLATLDVALRMQALRVEPAAALVEEVGQETGDLEAHPVGVAARHEAKPGARERCALAARFVVAVEGEVEARIEVGGAG